VAPDWARLWRAAWGSQAEKHAGECFASALKVGGIYIDDAASIGKLKSFAAHAAGENVVGIGDFVVLNF